LPLFTQLPRRGLLGNSASRRVLTPKSIRLRKALGQP
jgi:hypothetical protein